MVLSPLRLLHTSDVHVGGGYRPPDHGDHLEHCLCPVVALEDAVRVHRPDVVLVVGDLFDNQRVPAELVAEVLTRLGSLGAACVVANGNHDVHDEGTVYRPPVIDGTGVRFLDDPDGSLLELDAGPAAVWGKAMPLHHRGFRPLADAPEPPDDRWWIVLGHGHYEPDVAGEQAGPAGFRDLTGGIGRSSPLSAVEIDATGAHYVALGHWHVRTDVSSDAVTAWYSGAPYGFAASEQFNLVDLDPVTGVSVTALATELPPAGCRPG